MTDQEFMTGLYERALRLLDMIMKRGLELSIMAAVAILFLIGYLDQRAEINEVRREGKTEIAAVKREYKAAVDSVGRELLFCMNTRTKQERQIGELSAELAAIKKFVLKTTGLKK